MASDARAFGEVSSANPLKNLLEAWFHLEELGTSFAREMMGGLATFLVMSYIIPVNPVILSGVKPLHGAALPFAAVLTSTCVISAVMSIVMGFASKYPYAVAPGMGLNAVVAYGLVHNVGLTFPEAMGLVMLEGVAVTTLSASGWREKVMNAVPVEIKTSIAIGIGLFLAYIAFYNSGLIQQDPSHANPTMIGSYTTWPIFVVGFGMLFMLAMRGIRFKGDIIVGIIGTTVVAVIVNSLTHHAAFGTDTATWPGWHHLYASPDFSIVGKVSFGAFSTIGVVKALVWVFALFLSDFFDLMGTIIGVGKQGGWVDKNGEMPRTRRTMVADGIAAIFGGLFSGSSATTYIESGAGVAAGARTGLAVIFTGLLFVPFMFFAPVIEMVPAQATAPALFIVAWLMLSNLAEKELVADAAVKGKSVLASINFHDAALGLGAAATIIATPYYYSITDGIGWGFITFVVVRGAENFGRRLRGEYVPRDRLVNPFMTATAGVFMLYFLVPMLQQQVSWF